MDLCNICTKEFDLDDSLSQMYETICGHKFHEVCILRYFTSMRYTNKDFLCPHCNTVMNVITVGLLLHWSINLNLLEYVKILVELIDVNENNGKLLIHAAKLGNLDITKFLHTQANSD